MRAACGAVHWAGTETSDSWNGYVEGALVAGQERAIEVVQSLAAQAQAQAKTKHASDNATTSK